MGLACYLAMTAGEFQRCPRLPRHPAWMACHFSPYGTGLSNRPTRLPPGAMVILNDRTPVHGHDPRAVAAELARTVETVNASAVLLDLQRPGSQETAAIVREITGTLPCPVGVSHFYAENLSCPVFLPPHPPHILLEDYLAPWKGREVWLEAALSWEEITVTPDGAQVSPVLPRTMPAQRHADSALHCHYWLEPEDARARFTLFRTRKDLDDLLSEAETQGVALAVGLWQELAGTT